MANQDLTSRAIRTARIEAQAMWGGSNLTTGITPRVNVVQSILNSQTVNLSNFTVQDKCAKIDAGWLDLCPDGVADNTGIDDCDITGEGIQTNNKIYETDKYSTVSFEVKAPLHCNEIELSQLIAKGFMERSTEMDNHLNKFTISTLDSFSGPNINDIDYGTALSIEPTVTKVKSSFLNANIMANLVQTAVKNEINNPLIFSGSTMHSRYWNAEMEFANADGKGDLNKLMGLDWTFDLFNYDSILGAKKFHIVDPNTIGFFTWNKYQGDTTLTNGSNMRRFSFNSLNIAGVTYDVRHKTECVGDEDVHKFKLIARYDMFQAPTGACRKVTLIPGGPLVDRTGVLGFECVDA